MAFETMEWVKENEQDLVMLLPNFENSYDN
jgi:hypothetical protein